MQRCLWARTGPYRSAWDMGQPAQPFDVRPSLTAPLLRFRKLRSSQKVHLSEEVGSPFIPRSGCRA